MITILFIISGVIVSAALTQICLSVAKHKKQRWEIVAYEENN